jgi:riboflavin synthase
MFTGIVQDTGRIDSFEHGPRGGRLRVAFSNALTAARPLTVGASVAVNGCCLTVVEFAADSFSADLSSETLACTAFREKKAGDIVNLERPLAAGDEFGGHIVQGHVDGIGRVRKILPDGENWTLVVVFPAEIARYIVEKGSLTVDGVSLTVARLTECAAEIAIIPYTYQHTNLRQLVSGNAVNLECDVLAKYVERLLRRDDDATRSALTVERLIEESF